MLSLTTNNNEKTVYIRGDLARESCYEPLKKFIQEQTDPFFIDIDSCGGEVVGLASCCDVLARSGLATARISGVAASAAFFLALACARVECAEDAKVGSLGTMMIACENPAGYHTSIYSPRKNANDSQIEEILNDDAERLLNFVATQRGFVYSNTFEIAEKCGLGKLMTAKEAKERGLIDSITPCFEGVETMAKNNNDKVMAKMKCEEFEGEPMPSENVENQELTLEDLISKRDLLMQEIEELNKKIEEMSPVEEEEVVIEEEEPAPAENAKAAASLLRRIERLERAARARALAAIPACERDRAAVLYDGEQRGEHKLFSKHYATLTTQTEPRVSFGGKVEPEKIDNRTDYDKIKALASEKNISFTDAIFRVLNK